MWMAIVRQGYRTDKSSLTIKGQARVKKIHEVPCASASVCTNRMALVSAQLFWAPVATCVDFCRLCQ